MTAVLRKGNGPAAATVWLEDVATMPTMQASMDLAPGVYTADSVARGLVEERMCLWVWYEGPSVAHAMVSEIQVLADGRRVMHVGLAAGEGISESWRQDWPQIVAYGQAMGCQVMTFGGRPGWRRSGLLPQRVTRHWECCEMPLEVAGDE